MDYEMTDNNLSSLKTLTQDDTQFEKNLLYSGLNLEYHKFPDEKSL